MSIEKHEHTIGRIVHGGRVYEIDWPFEPDEEDDTERNAVAAFIFDSHGREVGEVSPPFGEEFVHESQVMTAAKAALTNGDIDDDQ